MSNPFRKLSYTSYIKQIFTNSKSYQFLKLHDHIVTDFRFFSSNIGLYVYRLHLYPPPKKGKTIKTQTNKHKHINTNMQKHCAILLCFSLNKLIFIFSFTCFYWSSVHPPRELLHKFNFNIIITLTKNKFLSAGKFVYSW